MALPQWEINKCSGLSPAHEQDWALPGLRKLTLTTQQKSRSQGLGESEEKWLLLGGMLEAGRGCGDRVSVRA